MLKVPRRWLLYLAGLVILAFVSLHLLPRGAEANKYAPGTCLKNETTGAILQIETVEGDDYLLRELKAGAFPSEKHLPVQQIETSPHHRPTPCPRN